MQAEAFSQTKSDNFLAGDKINLIEAQQSFAIIELQYRNSNERFQSTILAVDPETQTITIDETFPAGFQVVRHVPIEVTLRLARGRRRTFTTLVAGTQKHRNGSLHYQLVMPKHLIYMQRRESYRFKLGSAAGFAEFKAPGDYYCSGILLDISLTGLRMSLEQAVPMRIGASLQAFEFSFCHQYFNCAAHVQNIDNSSAERCAIGVAFSQMPRLQERALEKALMQLHRKIARQNTEANIAANYLPSFSQSETALALRA